VTTPRQSAIRCRTQRSNAAVDAPVAKGNDVASARTSGNGGPPPAFSTSLAIIGSEMSSPSIPIPRSWSGSAISPGATPTSSTPAAPLQLALEQVDRGPRGGFGVGARLVVELRSTIERDALAIRQFWEGSTGIVRRMANLAPLAAQDPIPELVGSREHILGKRGLDDPRALLELGLELPAPQPHFGENTAALDACPAGSRSPGSTSSGQEPDRRRKGQICATEPGIPRSPAGAPTDRLGLTVRECHSWLVRRCRDHASAERRRTASAGAGHRSVAAVQPPRPSGRRPRPARVARSARWSCGRSGSHHASGTALLHE